MRINVAQRRSSELKTVMTLAVKALDVIGRFHDAVKIGCLN